MRIPTKQLALAGFCLSVMACRSLRQPTTQTDNSTHIEVRSVVEVVHDTILYTPPTELQVQTITHDTSKLSTDLATSWAYVDTLGALHHALSNNDRALPIPITYERTRIDSVKVQQKAETIYVKVPTPLTRWQQTRLALFPYLLAIVALVFVRIVSSIKKKLR